MEDLPRLWNEKMKAYLGVEPANDAEGVLQDVHWSAGAIGVRLVCTAQFVSRTLTRLRSVFPVVHAGCDDGRADLCSRQEGSADAG